MQLSRSLVLAAMAITTPALAFSYQDNNIVFNMVNSAQYTGSYTVTAVSITDGQDPDNINYVSKTYTWSGSGRGIDFVVGRKGSSDVADWWTSQLEDNQTTFGHPPDSLNFGFAGTLAISVSGVHVTFPEIFIGQGSSGTSNNWWFGGKLCQPAPNGPSNTVQCTSVPDQNGLTWQALFHRGGNTVNEVDILAVGLNL